MRPTFSLIALLAALSAVTAGEFKPDAGFVPLFNGKDLTGWKTKSDGKSLAGKTDAANKRFAVKDGILVVDPKVKGDVVIEIEKSYGGDAVIKFEYKPGPGCNNDLFFHGMKFDLKKPDVKNLKEGEWNTFEVVVKGSTAEFKNNGEVQKTMKPKPGATPFGLRAEFGPIEYRHLQIKAAE